MTEDQRGDLSWLARNLRVRARECDPLSCQELVQLAGMLDHIRAGRGACAPVLQFPRRQYLVLIKGDRP